MKNIGMLTVRNEIDIIDEFLDNVEQYFEDIVVMDDSNDSTRERLQKRNCIKYLVYFEDVYDINSKRTDGQKQHLLKYVQEQYGNVWITNLNADAFFMNDPNKAIQVAEKENSSFVQWRVYDFGLHENDRSDYNRDKESWLSKNVVDRVTYVYDNYEFYENLQFKVNEKCYFDVSSHHIVVPIGISGKVASIKPVLFHYPYRSPEQIIKRRDDRVLTGFQASEYFEDMIQMGGFVIQRRGYPLVSRDKIDFSIIKEME